MRSVNPKPVPARSPRRLLGVALLTICAAVVVTLIVRRGHERSGIAIGPVELSMADLVLEDGRLKRPGSSTAFTGAVVENYRDGSVRSRSAVSNGLLHGLSQGWYTNGQLQITEHFQAGLSHGVRTKFHPNGTRLSTAQVVNGTIHGAYERWHDNGTLAEQVHLTNGIPDGESLAFHPDGSLKTRVRLDQGKVVEQSFWDPGQMRLTGLNPEPTVETTKH